LLSFLANMWSLRYTHQFRSAGLGGSAQLGACFNCRNTPR
jgi:hypothetical protein